MADVRTWISLWAACPEMTALADVVRGFAQLMADRRGTDLDNWIAQVRNTELVELEPFLAGLEQDHDAAIAGLTEPYSNGPIKGNNTKTKLIKRQMYGRAGFPYSDTASSSDEHSASPPKVRQEP